MLTSFGSLFGDPSSEHVRRYYWAPEVHFGWALAPTLGSKVGVFLENVQRLAWRCGGTCECMLITGLCYIYTTCDYFEIWSFLSSPIHEGIVRQHLWLNWQIQPLDGEFRPQNRKKSAIFWLLTAKKGMETSTADSHARYFIFHCVFELTTHWKTTQENTYKKSGIIHLTAKNNYGCPYI